MCNACLATLVSFNSPIFLFRQDIIVQLTPEKRSVNEGDDANFTCSPLLHEAPTLLNTIDPGSVQSEGIANTDSRIKVTNIPSNDSAGTTIFTWLSSSLADNGRQFFFQIGSFLSNSVTLYINCESEFKIFAIAISFIFPSH